MVMKWLAGPQGRNMHLLHEKNYRIFNFYRFLEHGGRAGGQAWCKPRSAIRLPGTDLLHMRARVYATELARFLEPDPVGFASGQLNLYSYVGGDPVNAVDPQGTADCPAGAADCPPEPTMIDPIDCVRISLRTLRCPAVNSGSGSSAGGIRFGGPSSFFIPGVSVGS
ncbi:MAG: RHS repeat-associated core domain-containing protein, partial [Calditrichaeota bacterium]